jgi:hypothetical protein
MQIDNRFDRTKMLHYSRIVIVSLIRQIGLHKLSQLMQVHINILNKIDQSKRTQFLNIPKSND